MPMRSAPQLIAALPNETSTGPVQPMRSEGDALGDEAVSLFGLEDLGAQVEGAQDRSAGRRAHSDAPADAMFRSRRPGCTWRQRSALRSNGRWERMARTVCSRLP